MNSYDINLEKVPTHIAIIMDGNGRWAKSRFLPRTAGHKAGVEAIREVIKESQRLGVKHLTLYAFSTENWKRPKLEVDTLMTLLATYLSKEIKELHANNVKVTAIGDISKLPKNCIEQLNNAFELTKDNTGVNLNLALNYGSRDDIKNAIIDILNDTKCGKINIEEINENTIKVVVEDRGHGIEDISMAMQPLYTSKPELERSGMGFTVMESFMDDITVSSIKDEGTKVVMTKKINLPE